MLAYCFQLSQRHVVNRDFRRQLLALLVELYKGLEVPDYISMCQCLLFLDDPTQVAHSLDHLIKQDSVPLHFASLRFTAPIMFMCSYVWLCVRRTVF